MPTTPHYPVAYDALGAESPHGGSAVDRVFAQMRRDQPWDYDYGELLSVQLAAFNERLAQRREQVPLVAQRVSQVGADSAEDLDEIMPFLFAGDVYKSYPQAFVAKGKWSSLLRWLDGLSSDRITGIDMDGVADIDEFLRRIRASGHYAFTTSGTTGKVSILPENAIDGQRSPECLLRSYTTMWQMDTTRRHPLFHLGHRSGSYRGSLILDAAIHALGRPDTSHVLFEQPLSISELTRVAALSDAMAKGTASPSQVAGLRESQQTARKRTEAALDQYIDRLAQVGDEPVYVWGQVYPLYLIAERAKDRGLTLRLPDGSVIIAGGGTKNNRLPDGYLEELRAFYGAPIRSGYGQSELHGNFTECERGAWHLPPTVLLLLTDETRERVLNQESGVVQGLGATFDFSPAGRWGGLLSNDVLMVNFSPCECGLSSPSVTDCRRYSPAAASDKVNCQGRIEMYIRGVNDAPDG
jgi:hypothetical protein